MRSRLEEDAVRGALVEVLGDRVGRVSVVGRTGSTSTDLVRAARTEPTAWPDRSMIVADHQAQGRGRSGRSWETPPGAALTVSVLLRPPASVPVTRFGWLSLMGGLAVVRALRPLGVPAVIKWPNDVLVADADAVDLPGWGRDRKVAGVLGELVPAAPAASAPGVACARGVAAVVGIGVNVSQTPRDLPVVSATSLAVCGVVVDRTELLVAVVRALVDLDDHWRGANGDAATAGIADECATVCGTLGSLVRVVRPGGAVLEGRATGLAGDGALRVVGADGREHSVLAGDVERVRV